MDLEKRINKIREQKEKFHLDNVIIAQYSGMVRTSVAKVLSLTQSDKRYLTESNVTAIEAGMEKILDEYRQEICGEKKA